MPVDGGDARQVTALPDGVKDMTWSPDGSAFVVVSRVDPDREVEGEEKAPRTQVARRVRYRDDEGWLARRRIFAVVSSGCRNGRGRADYGWGRRPRGTGVVTRWEPDCICDGLR